MSAVDVALDLPRMPRMSVGMTAYAEELARRLPTVAPDLSFATLVRTSGLDLAEQIGVPFRAARAGARLVHHLSVYAPFFGTRPTIVTIHDLIHLRFPEHFKRSVGPYYRTVVRAVCARAARVVTDDERTIEDLERYLGIDPRKVRVVPLGVDDAYFATTVPAPAARPYFIYAGNRRPHKDLATLVRAWASLASERAIDLALTGIDDGTLGAFASTSAASPVSASTSSTSAVPSGSTSVPTLDPASARGRIRYLGDLSTADLARHYAGAVALVYPSLCEGFGLPMLEAAAVGTPVIASSGEVPGVLRAHVRVFAARDVAALRVALDDALAGTIDASGARRAARDLTWDRCAERTAEVYRDVLAEGNRP